MSSPRGTGGPSSQALETPARTISVDDLPVPRTEIELSAPPPELELVNGASPTGKVLALVRLHTYPLGTVVLNAGGDLRWRTHASTVWSAVSGSVNAHLAADCLPCADDPDHLQTAPTLVPRCVRRRSAILTSPPPITVVIATRERPAHLRACLQALLHLEYPSYEVVVVDNDPASDRTARPIVDHFAPLVRYVRENRRGLAWAHNRGLQEVNTEIVAFVDDDVVVDRHWLTGIAEGFAAHADVGCVTGLILPAQLDTPAQLLLEQHGGFGKGFVQRTFDVDGNRPDDPLFPFTAGRLGSGANMAFRTDALRGLGGFDPATGIGTLSCGGDDLAAIFRVVLKHRLVYQPAALVWHHHHHEMAALQRQAFGYGVGLGAFLTSVMVHEPGMWSALLRRLPAGIIYGFSSANSRVSHHGWPSELTRRQRLGMLCGPARYAVSRWRAHRASLPG